jgi:hypothetical protein
MCPAPTVLRKKPLNFKVEARSRQDFVLMGVKGVELGSPMRYPLFSLLQRSQQVHFENLFAKVAFVNFPPTNHFIEPLELGQGKISPAAVQTRWGHSESWPAAAPAPDAR